MPPVLALAATLCFIGFLFYRDHKSGYMPSLALLIPCYWMLILGSRSFGEWLAILGLPVSPGGGDIAEGSPIDRAVFFILMGVGFLVLLQRKISWAQVFRNNIALVLFFLYCGLSILWSDFPFVAFKRWFKGFGDPIMILIILTDRDPLRAAETVFRVCANVLLPLSVLFIKYYPHLGRTYSEWTGGATYTGVTTNKNILGFMLMVCGLSLAWRLYTKWNSKTGTTLDNKVIPLILLGMVIWLFQMADSKTSLITLLVGILIFSVLGIHKIRMHATAFIVGAVLIFGVLQVSWDISTVIIEAAGRDATLTGRTELWEVVLRMQHYPITGYGFDSFWLGNRLKALQDRWYFRPTQAHSGYIELYLNLGWIGWAFFAGVIVSCFLKLRALLVNEKTDEWVVWARFGLAFLITYLMYNYTEAAFKTPHFLFVIFLLFAIRYKPVQQRVDERYPVIWPDAARKVPQFSGVR
jgi:exopolysaccharide production protein ExoQ